MLSGLDSLNDFNIKEKTPSSINFVYYLFWEKGISLKEFNELPIPYIMDMVNTHIYMKEQEAKAYKKANKKGNKR